MKKLLVLVMLVPALGFATDISQLPLSSASVKPNIILGYDDSGSMDWGYIPDSMSSSSLKDDYHYNPLAYDPKRTYLPWVTSVASDGTVTRAANATVTKLPGAITYSLGDTLTAGETYTVTLACSSGRFATTIDYDTGLVFTNRTTCSSKSGVTKTWATNYLVMTGQTWTGPGYGYYYNIVSKIACPTCSNAPVCPTGAVCTDDVPTTANTTVRQLVNYVTANSAGAQNYANWSKYYSSRQLTLASSLGEIISSLTGINMGILRFNTITNDKTVDGTGNKMYNLDDPTDKASLLAYIYSINPNSGTPTHKALNSIGKIFYTKSITQYACQKNAAFVITDGYANGTLVTPNAYTSATANNYPYFKTYAKSLADIAAAYYALNSNTDLSTGKVPIDGSCKPTSSDPLADCNSNLHMNTYALTLGLPGSLYVPDADGVYPRVPLPAVAAGVNSWGSDPTTSTKLDTVAQIDDLWHATINGRGLMFNANNPDSVVAAVSEGFSDIVRRSTTQSSIGLENVNLSMINNKIYTSSFDAADWSGDVKAYTVDINTGIVGSMLWSAGDQLDSRNYTSRKILVGPPSGAGWGTIPAAVQSYLKGNRTGEGSTYRKRSHVLGDAVNAKPVVNNGMVYQAMNDGMLHAFDATTGVEAWAYVPSQNIPTMSMLSDKGYTHRYFVDATPIVNNYKIGTTEYKLLIGGLGAGKYGYYAIDVTDPQNPVRKWEFNPAEAGSASIAQARLIATNDSSNPFVVVVPSGYNMTGSGTGYVWILNPDTGAIINKLTLSGTPVAGGYGLSTFAAFVPLNNTSEKVSYLYAGDEQGNVWKINALSAVSSWTIEKFASVGQPITTKLELTQAPTSGNPILLFGTGRLLGDCDKIDAGKVGACAGDTGVRGFYVIQDKQRIAPVIQKADLSKLTVTGGDSQNRSLSTSGSCTQTWANGLGWYFDFPQVGERLISNPIVNVGYVNFISNVVQANSCTSGSYSWILNLKLSLTDSCFIPQTSDDNPMRILNHNMGVYLSDYLSNSPTILRLPDGRIVGINQLFDGSFKYLDLGTYSGVVSAIRSYRELTRPMRSD